VNNHSRNIIKISQDSIVHWNNAGQLNNDRVVTINPYSSYNWHANDTVGWYDTDYDSFYLTMPQQSIGKKNYSSIFYFVLTNPHLQATSIAVNGNRYNFREQEDDHTLTITVNNDLTVTAAYDGNLDLWNKR
jgi:hypothetical protein